MSNEIDVTSLKFNTDGHGFTSNYEAITSGDEPEVCSLPPLVDTTLPALDQNLTDLLGGCVFTFPLVVPVPPIVVPKPVIPTILCPLGSSFSSDVTFSVFGNATGGGNLDIVENPDNPCAFLLTGGFDISVPAPICPAGTSFSGTTLLSFSGAIEQSVFFDISGGPCNFQFEGGGDIYIPPPICPDGTSFKTAVEIIGTGSAKSTLKLEMTGGPCDFELKSTGEINVPKIPCPDGMTFSGSVEITTSGIASAKKLKETVVLLEGPMPGDGVTYGDGKFTSAHGIFLPEHVGKFLLIEGHDISLIVSRESGHEIHTIEWHEAETDLVWRIVDLTYEAGTIQLGLTGGPCNFQLVGGGNIHVEAPQIPNYCQLMSSSTQMTLEYGDQTADATSTTAIGCSLSNSISMQIFQGWGGASIPVCSGGSLEDKQVWMFLADE